VYITTGIIIMKVNACCRQHVELNRFKIATNTCLVDAVDIITEAAADCGNRA